MEALETALALVMLVRKHTHHAISKKKCQFHLFLVYNLLTTQYYLILAEMKAELEKAKKEAEAAKKVGLQG